MDTLFSNFVEVHAFELGVLYGLIVVALVVSVDRRGARFRDLLVGVVGFGLGVTVSGPGREVIEIKPWYFLVPAVSLGLAGLAIVWRQ